MPAWEIDQSYDGVNQALKRIETRRIETLIGNGPQTTITTETETTWYVRSSLLGGQIVYELDESGNRRRANIYGIGGLLARGTMSGGTDEFRWRVADPVTGNWGDTSSAGGYVDTVQLDPLGAEVGSSDPYLLNPDPTYPEMKDDEPLYIEGGDPFDLSGGCTLDGMPVPCSFAFNSARVGASVAFSGATPSTAFVGGEYRYLRAFADGTYGLLPDNAFEVNGIWYDSTEMPIPGPSRSRIEYINIIVGDIHIMSRNWQRSAMKISQDPCPPTVAELMKNGNVKKALDEAWKKTVWFDPRQPNRGVVPGDVHEEGGWIFWYPKTKQVKTTVAPPGPRARDNNMVSEISLAGPTYPSGNNWILIADYHTHPNMNRILRNTPDHLRALNNGVPSIIKRGKEVDYVGPSRAGSRPLDARRPLRGYPGDTMDTRHCK
ncbi:MAG: hypothetical protein IPM66_19330 [Acidobacteriota bacterium]|nr:MAG: hypothetical protein IPM66_19330 [Acidobacteriota bacterium]